MSRTRSPLHVVVMISFLVAALSCILSIFYTSSYSNTFEYTLPVISFFSVFILCFIISRYFIKKYISQRLNPIYSLVRKRPGETEDLQNVNLQTDVFGNLNGEVKEWMESKNQELQSIKNLEQYRKDYVGNISHELKTPLTSVQGYIHTLLEEVEDPAIRRKFLEKAAVNTDRLIQIVDDLETITRIESGTNVIVFDEFNLKALTEDVIEDLSFAVQDKNITLNFNPGNLASYLAKGDKEAIRQVLNNLLINSIKYGDNNGTSTVKFYDMVDNFLIEVTDNGVGIEAVHLPHIFDRFYRIDKSRNRNIGGSGLGLSIVKHIIEAHNQTIHVKSQVGEGTRFSFTLGKV